MTGFQRSPARSWTQTARPQRRALGYVERGAKERPNHSPDVRRTARTRLARALPEGMKVAARAAEADAAAAVGVQPGGSDGLIVAMAESVVKTKGARKKPNAAGFP